MQKRKPTSQEGKQKSYQEYWLMLTSSRPRRIQGEKANYRKCSLLCKIKCVFGSNRIPHSVVRGVHVTHAAVRNAGRNTQPRDAPLVWGFITNAGLHVVPVLTDGKLPSHATENRTRPLQMSLLSKGLKSKE